MSPSHTSRPVASWDCATRTGVWLNAWETSRALQPLGSVVYAARGKRTRGSLPMKRDEPKKLGKAYSPNCPKTIKHMVDLVVLVYNNP